MEKYKYTLETKIEIGEQKAKSIFDYLRIIADQVGLILTRKEKVCQPKSFASQIQQELLKD
jgi:hypothetical protein